MAADDQQLQLLEPERDEFWCPSRCRRRCDAQSCVCPPCFCDRCRLRAQIAEARALPPIDLPPRPAFQPRLFPANHRRTTR